MRRALRSPTLLAGVAALIAGTTMSLQTPTTVGTAWTALPPDPNHDHHPSELALARSAVTSAAAPETLARTNWTVTADSQETAVSGYPAAAAIDGSAASFWHTRWIGTPAPLPHTLTIDMHDTVTVAALRYLPRPAAGGRNGNIGQYQIHVSADGATWGTQVAAGQFADDSAEKVVSFPTRSARYVRLTALSEAGGRGPWSNAAEINLLGHTDPVLPRAGWTVTADSQETARPGYTAAAAIDGSAASFWHTRWIGTPAPLPHTLTIDMHEILTVSGLAYLPRPAAGGRNGNIGRYQIHVSTDGTTWGTPVLTGTFADTSTEKTVTFPASTARYVRLTALDRGGRTRPVEQRRRDQPALRGAAGRPQVRGVERRHRVPAGPRVGGAAAQRQAPDLVGIPARHLRRRNRSDPDRRSGSRHLRGERADGDPDRARHVLPRNRDAARRPPAGQRRQRQRQDQHLQPRRRHVDGRREHEHPPRLPRGDHVARRPGVHPRRLLERWAGRQERRGVVAHRRAGGRCPASRSRRS